MFRHNFHTHTHYCDGSDAPEAYIRTALSEGLRSLGFSSHAPVPLENHFAIRDEGSLIKYCHEIRQLKEKYAGKINIYLGLEADYIPGLSFDFDLLKNENSLEYIIGSVHLVRNNESKLWFIDGPRRESWEKGLKIDYGGDIKKAVTAYYRQISMMVHTQKPDVIGHLDKIKMHNKDQYFREDEPWYKSLIAEVLDHIAASGCIVEVNSRGLYKKRSDSLFPGVEVLREMKKRNIPATISSDAHRPDEVHKLLDKAAMSLVYAGYREVYIFEQGEWKAIPLKDD